MASGEGCWDFQVVLLDATGAVPPTVRIVRQLFPWTVPEAGARVRNPPLVLLEEVGREQAEELKRRLEAAGAKAEIR